MNTKSVFKVVSQYFNEHHLAVCSLGRTSEECFLELPHSQVLFLDCLGSVAETAIGIAIGCPDSWVYAFDTDGSFMSNISSIHSLSLLKDDLKRYTLFLFDNQILESSGGQKSRLVDLDWVSLFLSWDLNIQRISTIEELVSFMDSRYDMSMLQVAVLDIDNHELDNTCYKDIDGIESRYLFKRYINDRIKRGVINPCLKN